MFTWHRHHLAQPLCASVVSSLRPKSTACLKSTTQGILLFPCRPPDHHALETERRHPANIFDLIEKETDMPIYFIGVDESRCTPIKIGVAKNIERRKRNLQTGNPLELRLLGWIETADPFQLEKNLHERFGAARDRGEWFKIQPADILPLLQDAGSDGFVAKNADAFQIVGYDRDAVPEYLGVWEWGDLEIEECCPFCGCLCGMHFQDASQMYHCIQCDTLTDFSELDPRDEPPED